MSTTDEVIGSIDHTLRDYGISPDAMRWTPAPAPAAPDLGGFQRAFGALGQIYNAYAKAVAKVAQEIGEGFARFSHILATPNHRPARCRRCKPFANPPALELGAEYHRRQKRRSHR